MQNHFLKLIAVMFALVFASARAETNFWNAPTGGDWEDTNAWSLGILPGQSQSVMITNGANDTVSINVGSASAHPESLIMNDLTVTGTATLLLDGFGTNTPVEVSSDLTLKGVDDTNRITLSCVNSALIVGNNLWLTNGQILESGGFIRVPNGNTWLKGDFYLTNAAFQGRNFGVGSGEDGYSYENGHFHQQGGTMDVGNLRIGSLTPGSSYDMDGGSLLVSGRLQVGDIEGAHFHQSRGRVVANDLAVSAHFSGSDYVLDSGELIVTSNLWITSYDGVNRFTQNGGTNWTAQLNLIVSVRGWPEYVMNAGALFTSNVVLHAANDKASIEQHGGVHVVANTLSLLGSAARHGGLSPAEYVLDNAFLSARNIEIQAGIFEQTNATTLVSDTIQLGGQEYRPSGIFVLHSGVVRCSNIIYAATGADIIQEGGDLGVTNLLSFGGYYQFWYLTRPAHYLFNGGTLFASNIELAADWFIGDSSDTGRITNPGYFKMAGFLTISNDTEQLGRFILASNAVIHLAGTNTSLSFADSSAEDWNPNAILLVTNWNGNLSGSGPTQLKFGTNQFGLTSAQLSGIRFRMDNPPGLYSAKILNTGEVVPDVPILRAVRVAEGKQKLILDWVPGWILQTATNIAGPYQDVPEAIPPFTNNMTAEPERFFRLR